ncbi:7-carboxy-7-deazaguanine synthase [Betaproteobacteria bacterium]|nr:7-carboxy-7-deazaguanine synthase [Betaproteobacteria bacterium]GHU42793.1 7-carboxy-7-deazaguanine synthase [Betaproteobacteria bacterium]
MPRPKHDAGLLTTKLRVCEIFFSLQGEAARVGLPSVFIRLTGCPLRCTWCDTPYAFTGGEIMPLALILDKVRALPTRHVCVTGGEPLAQKNCLTLFTLLCDEGYDVALETSGALDIGGVDKRVARILDLKTPSSGEMEKNRWENLALLTQKDEIKIVIADRADYDWAAERIREHRLPTRCSVLLSPVQGAQNATELAEWILADGLDVRFQMQLHKLLWGNMQGK